MEEISIALLRPPMGGCHVGSTDREHLMPLERSYMDVPERGVSAVLDQTTASDELARLSLAHEQLLRYARDLKCAYEAERERRARLAEATHDLMTVLAMTLSAQESGAVEQRNPIAIHAA
jgi:hypothetical protein